MSSYPYSANDNYNDDYYDDDEKNLLEENDEELESIFKKIPGIVSDDDEEDIPLEKILEEDY